MIPRFTGYTKGIIGLNLLPILFMSLYLIKGWHFRLNDYLDLIFIKELVITFTTVLVYLYWMSHLYAARIDDKKFIKGILVFIVTLLVALYGAGMHNAANQIRSVVNEPIVYFFDEIFSHYIFMTALLGMGVSISFIQIVAPNTQDVSKAEVAIIVGSGLFQGLLLGVGAMEAHFGYGALIISLLSVVLLYLKLRKSEVSRFPLSWYFLVYFLAISGFLTMFLIVNGHFVEPSTVF